MRTIITSYGVKYLVEVLKIPSKNYLKSNDILIECISEKNNYNLTFILDLNIIDTFAHLYDVDSFYLNGKIFDKKIKLRPFLNFPDLNTPEIINDFKKKLINVEKEILKEETHRKEINIMLRPNSVKINFHHTKFDGTLFKNNRNFIIDHYEFPIECLKFYKILKII